jgi:hypothetical protein
MYICVGVLSGNTLAKVGEKLLDNSEMEQTILDIIDYNPTTRSIYFDSGETGFASASGSSGRSIGTKTLASSRTFSNSPD